MERFTVKLQPDQGSGFEPASLQEKRDSEVVSSTHPYETVAPFGLEICSTVAKRVAAKRLIACRALMNRTQVMPVRFATEIVPEIVPLVKQRISMSADSGRTLQRCEGLHGIHEDRICACAE